LTRLIKCSLLLLSLATLAACNQQEKLHRVSGVVTYDGKPIPKGRISFDPREKGLPGEALIVDGKYDTAVEGRGVRGGTYDLRVLGFDGKKVADAPFGNGLFPEYTGTAELPEKDSTFDLNIPKK
jgi:hypothetical protein